MYCVFVRLVKLAGALFVLFTLTACMTHVRSTVSTFQGEDALVENASFHIVPTEAVPADFDELEFRYYANRLATELVKQGYSSAAADSAQYKVVLQYDTTRQRRDFNRSRLRFHTSLGHVYRYGSVVLVDNNDYNQFEYARRVKVSIEEKATAEQVVSLSAVSYGQCENLSSVFDEMLVAILQAFHFSLAEPQDLDKTLRIKKSWIPGIYYTE